MSIVHKLLHKKNSLLLFAAALLILILVSQLVFNLIFRNTKPSASGTQKLQTGVHPRPTQSAFQIVDSYSGIDYQLGPEHDAIADSAVCRDIKTFTHTTFAPAAADPEHTCSLTISSDNELAAIAALSARFTQLKIVKIVNTKNTRLPAEIGDIRSLGRIIIQNTQNTVLPPEIGKLDKLIELTVDNAHIEQLPKEIGQLTNLEELNITNNKEFRSLPLEISNLRYLWKIIAINNSLNSLPVLPRLQNGTVLSLKGNQLSEFPRVLLSRSRVITFVDLSDNWIRAVPSEINQTQIRVLTMSNNRLTSFPTIDQMQLLSLNLSRNKLTNIDSLPKKEWLQVLDLSNNNLVSITLVLSDMTNLKSLHLGGNALAVLPLLPDAKGMQVLDVSFNHLNALPDGIERLIGLAKINITGNPIARSEREKLKELFPNAEIIY